MRALPIFPLLAILASALLLTELLRRYPEVEVVGEIERMRSYFLNSIKRMQVRLGPQRLAA